MKAARVSRPLTLGETDPKPGRVRRGGVVTQLIILNPLVLAALKAVMVLKQPLIVEFDGLRLTFRKATED